MNFIHVRNLEKFHPGYRDRQLHWAKIHFSIIQGDPDLELVESEIDRFRFVAMICLELEAKKPLPDTDKYWSSKGFNIKKRPMSLTLKMLQKFVDINTESRIAAQEVVCIEESREEKKREEKKDWVALCFGLSGGLPGNYEKAWSEWLSFRASIKKPMSVVTARKQLEFLRQQSDFVECINQSIRNGWQGLFPVDERKSGARPAGQPVKQKEHPEFCICKSCGEKMPWLRQYDHTCKPPDEPLPSNAEVDEALAKLKSELKPTL
jgi:hypothetical protein